jgi:hypothetical protein
MKIIRPVTITDSIFQSSTVPEADQAEWLSGTTYHVGNLVMVTTTANGAATATHKIYSSVHSQAGNDPTVDDGTNWTEVSSTNRWKMFDAVVQDQTVNATSINTVLQSPTVVNSLALLNVDGTTVVVTVTDAVEGVVYNETFNLTSYSGIQDWYAYFFEPIVRKNQLALTDLPPYSNTSISVTINSGADAKVGALVIGQFADLGLSQHGASISIIDYSTKTTDSQGRVTITDGPYADKMDVDVVLDTSQIGQANTTLSSLRTTPAVWVAEDNNDDLVIYGYYREFDIILSNPTISRLSLEIEGLV